jgi:hypothetical protein
MDDYRYSELLHDPAAFGPQGMVYSIEIWKYAVRAVVTQEQLRFLIWVS